MPQQSLIDFAISPPLGILNAFLDTSGPYGFGDHTLTTWTMQGSTRRVADTFGVVLNFNGAIPPELGLKLGYSDGASIDTDEFDMRLVQLVAMHQLFNGAWVTTQIANINVLPYFTRWTEALPGRVGLYVSPHIQVDLFYLLT